ncbi:metallophosphoesterase [Metallumcola ferriviriculae]|uniref:Metallophosphoesterase n=1 Tax=Metallumcola ferriviriculae TaxID=3039180 RepID=A0AAU0UJC4_9FIRM|nr:metallophosphoesterase [Desulfitibacteraceae bacterium MK1]
MKPSFVLLIGSIILTYAGINFYIGLRGWQSIGRFIPFLSSMVYWSAFWLMVFSYILSRLTEKYLPDFFTKSFSILGGYWIPAMVYLLVILLTLDCLRLIDRHFSIFPKVLREHPYAVLYTGFSVLLILLIVFTYGTFNSRNIKITNYQLPIPKETDINQLHAVLVSDIHLGLVIGNKRLTEIIEKVNSLKPDIVFLAGDILEENINQLKEKQQLTDTFRQLNAKYGVFAILGNHEYIGGSADSVAEFFKDVNVITLRDQYAKIADSFYVLGRDDLSTNRFNQGMRQDLSAIMRDIDKSLPMILLDHQPSRLDEAQQEGIDLQLSGHTHRGQFFPFNLITDRIFEVDWGYLKKDDLQVIVSSGAGTWGPPIRIASRSEIVSIKIKLDK